MLARPVAAFSACEPDAMSSGHLGSEPGCRREVSTGTAVAVNHHSLELRTPLRASWVQVLRLLDGLLRDKQIRYLLAGGNAREILLMHVHGCAPGRVTTDLDFGLIVSDWTLFDDLKAAMGPIPEYERALATIGLVPAGVSIPAPHGHQYNAEFDGDEDRLMAHCAWIHFPLLPSDDP